MAWFFWVGLMSRDERGILEGGITILPNVGTLILHAYAISRDREWQKWPITIVAGAYAGCVIGKVVGGYLLRGKRIEFD